MWLESPLRVCLDLLLMGEPVAVLYVPPSNIPKDVYVVVEAVNNCSNGSTHFRALQKSPREGKPLVQHVEVTPKLEIRPFHPGIHHTTPSWEFFFYVSLNNPPCTPRALAHPPNVSWDVQKLHEDNPRVLGTNLCSPNLAPFYDLPQQDHERMRNSPNPTTKFLRV